MTKSAVGGKRRKNLDSTFDQQRSEDDEVDQNHRGSKGSILVNKKGTKDDKDACCNKCIIF